MLHYCHKFVKTNYKKKKTTTKGMINIMLGKKAELSGNFLYQRTSVNVAKCQPYIMCEKGGIISVQTYHFIYGQNSVLVWGTCMQRDVLYDFFSAKPFFKK